MGRTGRGQSPRRPERAAPPARAAGTPLPLLVEPPVLLAVGAVDLQQGLQVVVVRLHVLVVHVDIIQLPLLLENLLGGAWDGQVQGMGPWRPSPKGTRPTPPRTRGVRGAPCLRAGGPWGAGRPEPGFQQGCHRDWGQEAWAGHGEGPILTGHIGHLYLQALDVSHVHIEERLGLGNGAPDARQGDVGQTAAAVHCGPGEGTEEEAVREEECASPPSQPAAPSSEQPASKDAVEALLRAVLQPESPQGSGILRGRAGPRAFRVPQQNPISSDTNGALPQQTDSVQPSPHEVLLGIWRC